MLQPVRGTKDLLGMDAMRYRKVLDTIYHVAATYNFQEIQTPIFEFNQVFQRTLGETSDIVSKEMYTFADKGGDVITLRPEGTAPVVRAVISNGLTQNVPLKFMYSGPMFRYERPQKGRQRQFHQIGAELMGPNTPMADAEMIAFAHDVLKALGINDDVKLHLNTLGDTDSRQAYRTALIEYFKRYEHELSMDSQARLHRNPLRILDSKDEQDQRILESAPLFKDYLNHGSLTYFENVQHYLNELHIPYVHDQKLVRGLDYYSQTTFEFITEKLGAQGTLLAGGRYDGLMAQMGGPHMPAIGWAAGIERLSLMLSDEMMPSTHVVTVIPLTDQEQTFAFKLTQSLRNQGIVVDMGYSGNVSKRLKKSAQHNHIAAIIIGPDDVKSNHVIVKFLNESRQENVPVDDLFACLNQHIHK